jgi:SAM-dependent MidA family methyltransferase
LNALAERIARSIAGNGPLTIATFMTMALHDPYFGFYAVRESIGAQGAFTTAPEISQIFGELMGLWCAQVWCDQGRPAHPRLVELGPGRGTLMADALRALRVMPEFCDSLEIVLVEASPVLEAMQRERLATCGVALRWVKSLSDIEPDRPLFLIANEFLDALPIRQFVRTERGWCERMVTLDTSGELAFALSPFAAAIQPPPRRGDADLGAVFELAPAALALVEDVGRMLTAEGGAALFVDYGYADQGFGETLQAVRHHQRAGILDAPGESDLSAHVDFASLARNAAPASAHGPVSQQAFLRQLGIAARAEQLAARNPDAASEVAAGVARLLNPESMGTLFKVFALAPGNAPPLPGF